MDGQTDSVRGGSSEFGSGMEKEERRETFPFLNVTDPLGDSLLLQS